MSSWDRFEIPMPFSRVLFVYGEPIEVPRKLDGQDSENYRLAVEQSLKDLMELGEREFEELYRLDDKKP